MKIQELQVKGFRSLKHVNWRPGDLNVVIGPNGTGKSNLLRVFELLRASANGELGRYIQGAGGIDPLLWDGRAESLDFHLVTDTTDNRVDAHVLGYELQLVRLGPTSSFRVQHEKFANGHTTASDRRIPTNVRFDRTSQRSLFYEDQSHTHLLAVPGSFPDDESLLSTLTSILQVTSNISDITDITDFRKWVTGWSVYHDVFVTQNSPIRMPTVARFEKTVDSDGKNLIQVLHTLYTGDRDFKRAIDDAMRAAFGSDFEELAFPPASDQRIQLRVRWKTRRREQSAADLSDGTLRFLFLLTCLASPSPAPVIVIDEPETGLHPSMLPIIAEYAVNASERAQVIFTTHSDQFLDAFGESKPTTTVASWQNGETSLKTIDGEALDYWLKEYSLGALYRSGELEAMA